MGRASLVGPEALALPAQKAAGLEGLLKRGPQSSKDGAGLTAQHLPRYSMDPKGNGLGWIGEDPSTNVVFRPKPIAKSLSQ